MNCKLFYYSAVVLFALNANLCNGQGLAEQNATKAELKKRLNYAQTNSADWSIDSALAEFTRISNLAKRLGCDTIEYSSTDKKFLLALGNGETYKAYDFALGLVERAKGFNSEWYYLNAMRRMIEVQLHLGLFNEVELFFKNLEDIDIVKYGELAIEIRTLEIRMVSMSGNLELALELQQDLVRRAQQAAISKVSLGKQHFLLAEKYAGLDRFNECRQAIKLSQVCFEGLDPKLKRTYELMANCVLEAHAGHPDLYAQNFAALKGLMPKEYDIWQFEMLQSLCEYRSTGEVQKFYNDYLRAGIHLRDIGKIGDFVQISHLVIKALKDHEEEELAEIVRLSVVSEAGTQFDQIERVRPLSGSFRFEESKFQKVGLKSQDLWLFFGGLLFLLTIPVVRWFVKHKLNRSPEVFDEAKSRNVKYLSKLEDLMSEPSFFCNPDISLVDVAEILGTNKNYISKAVNDGYGLNFKTYLARKRLKYFCEIANQDTHRHMKLEVLAFEVGFKSKATFNQQFKKQMGCTPTEYIKQCKEKGGGIVPDQLNFT